MSPAADVGVTVDAALRQASKAAFAVGQFFHIGVRTDGSWFAHCDGVEYDGGHLPDGPIIAVNSVVDALRRRTEQAMRASEAEGRKAEQTLAAMPLPFVLPPEPE